MQIVSFQPTAEDLIAANRLLYTAGFKSWRFVRAFAFGGAVFAIIALSSVWGENLLSLILAAVVGFLMWALLLSIILLGTYLQLPRRVRRIYLQQKGLHGSVEVAWTNTQVTFSSSRGSTTFDWSDFIRARKNNSVLIFLQSDVLFNFIPIRALTAEQASDLWQRYGAALPFR